MSVTYLGIELGSTRIKAVALDGNYNLTASGWHNWESKFEGGYWTYPLDEALNGVRGAFASLAADYKSKTGDELRRVDAMGISAMMHGYLAFDKEDNLLTPFRTWKNETTAQAAETLTEAFNFNIPQRWSAAHLYQAILNGEPHVKNIAFMTTLAGYVHWKLTGEKVLGVGDASGMFPVSGNSYDGSMAAEFSDMTGIDITKIFPGILTAGQPAGRLTKEGAKYLDPTGALSEGAVLCPPEGDAGSGMVATNCVEPRSCNISAGTSIFAMAALERPLSKVRAGIDVVTTPEGFPVAMAHYNECASLIDPWIELFGEAVGLFGFEVEKKELFTALYEAGANEDGSRISKFMRERLTEAVKNLADGMKTLINDEGIKIDRIVGHGGYFKSGNAGRKIISDLLGVPVTLKKVSAEGGAYGTALLAAYAAGSGDESLSDFLRRVDVNETL